MLGQQQGCFNGARDKHAFVCLVCTNQSGLPQRVISEISTLSWGKETVPFPIVLSSPNIEKKLTSKRWKKIRGPSLCRDTKHRHGSVCRRHVEPMLRSRTEHVWVKSRSHPTDTPAPALLWSQDSTSHSARAPGEAAPERVAQEKDSGLEGTSVLPSLLHMPTGLVLSLDNSSPLVLQHREFPPHKRLGR